jgi:hypothetical protein
MDRCADNGMPGISGFAAHYQSARSAHHLARKLSGLIGSREQQPGYHHHSGQ